MKQNVGKIEFFVSGERGCFVTSFEGSEYESCDLYELRQDQGQLKFIKEIEKHKYLVVIEVFARLTVIETCKIVKILIDPVFKGGTIFPARLEVIRNHYKGKGFDEINMSFCDP